jgi:arylsulfatase
MRKFFYVGFTAIILTGCGESLKKEKIVEMKKTEQKKPNILLLVGDDTAFGDIGAYGSEVKIPNITAIRKFII